MSPAEWGGLGTLAVALFWVGMAIRGDARLTARFRKQAAELDRELDAMRLRLSSLERRHARERERRRQLETVLLNAGMTLPPWLHTDDDEPPATGPTRLPRSRT